MWCGWKWYRGRIRRGVVVEPDEEEDGAWDVDEGIYPVDPRHGKGMLEEELLDWQFPEYV